MLRAIREIEPRWILGENVYGLVNWNDGLVLDQVCSDLENEGYQVQPVILPAVGRNAIHRRRRVWIVAYSDGSGKANDKGTSGGKAEEIWREKEGNVLDPLCGSRVAPNSNNKGLEGNRKKRKDKRWGDSKGYVRSSVRTWQQWPTQSPVCGADDGISIELDGFKLSKSKHRQERIKGLGNAIVPQIAYSIFQTIEKFELQV